MTKTRESIKRLQKAIKRVCEGVSFLHKLVASQLNFSEILSLSHIWSKLACLHLNMQFFWKEISISLCIWSRPRGHDPSLKLTTTKILPDSFLVELLKQKNTYLEINVCICSFHHVHIREGPQLSCLNWKSIFIQIRTRRIIK